VAFTVTVIVTRVFLELTGYPQIGNSVLHIAHALWGGLLLIVAGYLPLAYVNRWTLQASALLGGVGIGLFIDEVGKFITQDNDYFFPAALPLIYGFVLLNALVVLYFRRTAQENARAAIIQALEALKDAVDGDLDSSEAARIEKRLVVAQKTEQAGLALLAKALGDYLQQEKANLPFSKPGFWKRIAMWVDGLGVRLGRYRHRVIITVVFLSWVIFAAGYVLLLIRGAPELDPRVLAWRIPLIAIQIIVGLLMAIASVLWMNRKERQALRFGVSGFLISLVGMQLLYFFLSQFSAIIATLLQLVLLQLLLSYRRWYLS
jgi:hypothetical protein